MLNRICGIIIKSIIPHINNLGPTPLFCGRNHEAKTIFEAIASRRAELGIVYGRRRIGKSTLLKRFIKSRADFYFEGLQHGSESRQIEHFSNQLAEQHGSAKIAARTWEDIFDHFTTLIRKGRHYVIFDELPWMASNRPDLVALLKFYWDNRWKENPGVKLVLCGSIAKFMVEHVVHSRALHNRKTFEIRLEALSVRDAMPFFGDISALDALKYMMVFGGVPKYLEQINRNRTFAQNVDALCFLKNGFFTDEFETIFKEQFKVFRTYETIVTHLSRKSQSSEELGHALRKNSGGGFIEYVRNLERADFVRTFQSFSWTGSSSKTQRIYLWDEWLRFYFTFMRPRLDIIRQNTKPGFFAAAFAKKFEAYCGIAFERLCLKNMDAILDTLEIPWHAVQRFAPFFRQPPRGRKAMKSETGVQVDIVIEQKAKWLTLVECKFSSSPVGVAVADAMAMKIKAMALPRAFSVQRVLIAPGGVTTELEDLDYFHRVLDAKAVC